MILKIAFRNILRNRRRSVMTVGAVAIGTAALLLFGAFIAFIIVGLEVVTVRGVGHLFVFRPGYFQFGASNPAAYGIPDYEAVTKLITGDPTVGPMVNVATPTVTLFGIAGNFAAGASTTFFGVGMVPADLARMGRWDQYGIADGAAEPVIITDEDTTRGVIGVGLARILGLCATLRLADCPPPAPPAERPKVQAPREDFSELVRRDLGSAAARAVPERPQIDLRAATAGGAPNAVSLTVGAALRQGAKELDDSFVGMHLALAQRLLYGRGARKVTSIVLQLHRTGDMGAAQRRIDALFREHGLDLEVRDFKEVVPLYNQVVRVLSSMFTFIAVIMATIVLFTVVNTMSMTVMERTNEIGTLRALGIRRSGIRRQFLVEGWMLGALGATVGSVLAVIIAYFVNHAGLTWTPPLRSGPVPLLLLLSGVWTLIIGTWLGITAIATVAALISANRAARLPVVDALRYV